MGHVVWPPSPEQAIADVWPYSSTNCMYCGRIIESSSQLRPVITERKLVLTSDLVI